MMCCGCVFSVSVLVVFGLEESVYVDTPIPLFPR